MTEEEIDPSVFDYDELIEHYDGLNADETLSAVDDFTADQLQQFVVHERMNKNRTTVIEPIQDMLVTIRAPRGGYFGGQWFDEPGERVVRDTTRIRQALEDTELELVD